MNRELEDKIKEIVSPVIWSPHQVEPTINTLATFIEEREKKLNDRIKELEVSLRQCEESKKMYY